MFLLFALHFLVFLLSASLLFFLVSLFFFFPPCLPSGTKESIAAGHTGGMEAVLLFRPWCLLCKIGGGGCYWSTVCTCVRSGWGGVGVLHKSLSCTFQDGSTARRPNKAERLQNMNSIDWLNCETPQSKRLTDAEIESEQRHTPSKLWFVASEKFMISVCSGVLQ